MRNLSDYVAKQFAALGLPEVRDHALVNGMQAITFAGGVVSVTGPFASDAEIIAAARKAHNMTDDNIETVNVDAVPTVPPPVEIAPAPAPTSQGRALPPRTPTTPGDHASSIQDMMQSHARTMQDIRDATIQTLRISLERQAHALSAAPKKVAEKIDSQTDDFLSFMAQFTNDLGV